MDSPILSLLKTKEAFELHILAKYQDILDRTFQVIYEIKASVSWENIYRYSPESNFIMVVGFVILEKGMSLGDTGEIKEESKLSVSFTIPWAILDDDTTPYQIADIASSLRVVSQVMGPKEFVTGLKDKSTTMKTLQKYIPADVTEKQVKEEPEDEGKKLKKHPHFISTFDLDELTDKQKEAFNLTMMWDTTK